MAAATADTATRTASEAEQRDALTGRLFESLLSGMELLSVHLGSELGLYEALQRMGTATPRELAREARIHERYAREWLEQQAVAGVVDVAEDHADEYERRFLLPTGHAEALLDPESPSFAAAAPQALRGLATVFGDVLRAYRSGGGVPYSEQGAEVRRIIAGINRPMFVNELGSAWLPAVPELHARLRSLAEPRVLDLGCGTGWSSIARAPTHRRGSTRSTWMRPRSKKREGTPPRRV